MNRNMSNNDFDVGPKRQPKHTPSTGIAKYEMRAAKRSRSSPVPTEESSWTEQMHREFVESIMQEGIDKASPSVILEHMSLREDYPSLSNEHIKSHLQKYRRNQDKSMSEFLHENDSWIQRALTMGASNQSMSPRKIVEMMGSDEPQLLGGHVSAFLSFAEMMVDAKPIVTMNLPPEKSHEDFIGAKIPYPVLTPQESRSPLGISIMRVMALCTSMTQYMLEERDAAKQEEVAGHDETTRSIQGEPAAAAWAAGSDPSTDTSSMLEPIDIEAADIHQVALSNFPSFFLPREGDSIQPHRTEGVVAFEPIAYSSDDAFQQPSRHHLQSSQFILDSLNKDSPDLGHNSSST
jgi:SHAQKYF class myb-like DNA-binding protein